MTKPAQNPAKSPALRFKNANGNPFPDWEEKRLGDVVSVKTGDSNREDSTEEGLYAFFDRSNDIRASSKFIFDCEAIIVAGEGKDFIPRYFKGKFDLHQRVYALTAFEKNIALYLYFWIYHHRNFFLKNSVGSTVPSLRMFSFSSFPVAIPHPDEQKKIADFLTAMDDKIDALTRKRDLLEDYKRGLMQQLFSQKIRFKDKNGKPFPDWEEKQLGDVSNITTGKLDANAMKENGQYRFYTCAKEHYLIDKYAFDTEALLISGNGVNVGYIHYYKGKFNAYQRTYVLDGFEDNIIFIKFFLQKKLKQRISYEKKDGNTPYIILGTLADMKINTPHPDEQKKIADFLTAMDGKIDALTRQRDQMEIFKRALMQKMFV